MNHLNKNKNFKNFIIGVSDAKQLKEINAILNKKEKNDLAFFKLDVVSKRLSLTLNIGKLTNLFLTVQKLNGIPFKN